MPEVKCTKKISFIKFSLTGFLTSDEDILSVIRGDNELVRELGITHPQMADLVKTLSVLNFSEMVPYYIMRYGFY